MGIYALLAVYTSCPTAVNQDHIACDLTYTIHVSQGGQHSRAAGRRSQGAGGGRNVRFAHARAPVSTLLLYALGLVVRCPAARFVQRTFCAKSKADFF